MTSTGDDAKPTQPATGGLEPGAVFRGSYQIVRRLSSGGMGAVYECVHRTTRKRRALKVMLPQLVEQAALRERFELEARVTADIESDHVVETFDAGVDEATGVPFLVMELLRGEDLDSQLRARGPLAPEDVVDLLAQAAHALDKTHAAGIVHRDLKPQNLFVTTRDDGTTRLKVLDFGIAKVVAESERASHQTATLGTPVYMSPEQIDGEGVGPWTDIYALGHVAFTLLTGEAYWEEENQASHSHWGTWKEIMAGAREPASLRAGRRGVALPVAFDAWFLKATAKAGAERFERANEMVAALADALAVARPRLSMTKVPAPRTVRLPGAEASVGTDPTIERVDSGGTVALPGPATPPSSGTTPPRSATTTSPVSEDHPADDSPVVLPVKSRAPFFVVFAGFPLAAALAGLGLRGTASPSPTAGPAAVNSVPAAVSGLASAPSAAEPVPTVSPAASVSAAPSVTRRSPAARPVKPAEAPTKPIASCSPPYTLDPAGNKHAKPECL